MALKDVKLEEKEQFIVEEVVAKNFKDKDSGFSLPKRYYVGDITKLTGDLLDKLEPGDSVVKIDGVYRHTYLVSYKGVGVGQGICLTYCAAGLIETHSYDLTSSGWQYNSKDIWQQD